MEPLSSDPQTWRKAGEQPNLNSEDESENSLPESSTAASGRKALEELGAHKHANNTDISTTVDAVSNKAFSCCIRQYGAKVKENDPSKANAGSDKKWKRMFGLFGTQIL